MLTVLHTSTSAQVGVVAVVSVVPLSSVAVVVSLNVVLPVPVAVVIAVVLLLSHCFSIEHFVWKQFELDSPDRDLESEDEALDPFVEDDFDV